MYEDSGKYTLKKSVDLQAQILEVRIHGQHIFVNTRFKYGNKRSYILKVDKDDINKQVRKYECPENLKEINAPYFHKRFIVLGEGKD